MRENYLKKLMPQRLHNASGKFPKIQQLLEVSLMYETKYTRQSIKYPLQLIDHDMEISKAKQREYSSAGKK